MEDFYSHIERDDSKNIISRKLLRNHLSEVGRGMARTLSGLPLAADDYIARVGFVIGVGHDFGKYTTYFQKYLLTGSKSGDLHQHGFISGLWVSYQVFKLLESDPSTQEVWVKYLPLMTYFTVRHHHGNLNCLEDNVGRPKDKNFSGILEKSLKNRLQIVRKQVPDLAANMKLINEEYKTVYSQGSFDFPGSVDDFLKNWLKYFTELDRLHYFFKQEDEQIRQSLWAYTVLHFSCLIDLDKRDAAETCSFSREYISYSLVDSFKKQEFSRMSAMNGLREEIYGNVLERVCSAPLEQKLFTLTAPTGSGKTLTSLAAALNLRQRVKEEKGYTPRIIYALPFTSIIDQNYEVFRKVLGQVENFSQEENKFLLKHHHLADPVYKVGGEDLPLDEALMLIESWDSEIIVTTFMQLFHTLLGYKNRMLKKFHNLAGSILLLDEVQSLPVEYWSLVSMVLKTLAKQLGCYIILLTATRPLIFSQDEAYELAGHEQDVKKHFSKLDRVKVFADLTPQTVEKFAGEFIDNYNPDKSYLVVLNTIKSSLDLFKLLRNSIGKEYHDVKLYYLSTNIIPLERAERIRDIKNAIDGNKNGDSVVEAAGNCETNNSLIGSQKVIVISTQVVEAGVDIDLDMVYRDLGPVDSIVQVAGRCNRNNGKESGIVKVINLTDGQRSLASMIYGVIHCKIAKELLDGKTIAESEFYENINHFFEKVMAQKNTDLSGELINAISKFRFQSKGDLKGLSDFRLIEEKPNYVDVFVEVDEKAQEIWQRYLDTVVREYDVLKRKYNFLKMKKAWRSYMISIPLKYAKGLIHEGDTLFRLPLEGLELYYDPDIGFKRDIENDFWAF